MLVKGYNNQRCGETPIDVRMGIPANTMNVDRLSVTETEMRRKAAINAPYQFRKDPRKLEDWLEMQPRRFVTLGINTNSYNVVI
jgi:hypothetical protein